MKDNSLITGGHSMKRLLIAVAAVVAVLALAACGGGGGDSGETSAAPPTSNTATVSAEEIGDSGRVLVDSTGKALYTSEEEAESDVVCTEACAEFWIPLTIEEGAPTGDAVPGDLGVAERSDGTRQVTLDGERLYTFVEDEPGQVTGDGFSDAFDGQQFTWHVVSVGGSPDSDQGGDAGNGPFDY
jgi:predicted lipoprotein with Yx(FWY)xxD motif